MIRMEQQQQLEFIMKILITSGEERHNDINLLLSFTQRSFFLWMTMEKIDLKEHKTEKLYHHYHFISSIIMS